MIYLFGIISKILHIKLDDSDGIITKVLTENITLSGNIFYTIFFLATTIYGASTLFFHLIKAGEMVYQVSHKKFRVVKRISALIFMIFFISLIESFLLILLISKYIFSNSFLFLIKYLIYILIPYIISICLHFFATPNEVKYKDIKKGAIITTIFWFLATIIFNVFVKIFTNFKAIYGALSFFIIFMIWIYLISQGFVFGIIYNYYYKEKNINLLDIGNNNIGTPKEDYEKI